MTKNSTNSVKPWQMFCKFIQTLMMLSITDRLFLIHLSPPAGNLFVLLPFFESWRKFEPVWLRRSLANLAYVLPWSALRQFKKSIDTMHPVYAQIFYEKKETFRKGGITALANTASGGRDLTTLLSRSRTSSVMETCWLLKHHQSKQMWRRMEKKEYLTKILSLTWGLFLSGIFQYILTSFVPPSGFVLGGQTPASAISRLLDLMTSNPSLQTWLREEITEALAVRTRIAVKYFKRWNVSSLFVEERRRSFGFLRA